MVGPDTLQWGPWKVPGVLGVANNLFACVNLEAPMDTEVLWRAPLTKMYQSTLYVPQPLNLMFGKLR
jgi:hypothetical protein